ncbi:MAG: DUF3592 domain-containing protein [Clostridia bacterium]|nr:DUF3592 domain-containing protein [Clostridia bacterium]
MARITRVNGKMQVLIAILLAVIGAVVLIVGITFDMRYARYEETTAIIVDLDYSRDSDGDYMVSYTYEYTVNGQTFRRKSNSSTSENISHRIGDVVTIKYDPKNPNKIIESVWVCVLLTGTGTLFLVAGAAVIVSSIIQRRKYGAVGGTKSAEYDDSEDLQIDENGNVIISDAEGNIITADGVIPASGVESQVDNGNEKINDVNDINDVFDI